MYVRREEEAGADAASAEGIAKEGVEAELLLG